MNGNGNGYKNRNMNAERNGYRIMNGNGNGYKNRNWNAERNGYRIMNGKEERESLYRNIGTSSSGTRSFTSTDIYIVLIQDITYFVNYSLYSV